MFIWCHRMKVAIDVDDVAFKFLEGFCKFYNETRGAEIDYKGIDRYDVIAMVGGTFKEAVELCREYYESTHFSEAGVVDGAVVGVEYLKNNHDIYFVTARPESAREMTADFLKDNFGVGEDRLIFSGEIFGGKSKDEICREMGIGYIIEDNGPHSLKYAKSGLGVFLLDNSWNQGVEHDNIFRCKSWGEIMEKIREVSDE